MTQDHSKVKLNTYLLYHQNDLNYYHDVKARLHLLVEDKDLGNLKGLMLEAFSLRARQADKIIASSTCLICLLTPNFAHAIRSEEYHWTKLVNAHLNRQLLLVPILAEPYDFKLTPFKSISELFQPQYALSERREMPDYAGFLAGLMHSCEEKLARAIVHNTRVATSWKRTQEIHSVAAYRDFCANFKTCKYYQQAKQYGYELLEEELWDTASSFDDTNHYLYYLTESPLAKYRQQAVARIIEIETDPTIIKNDVSTNLNEGLVFDYKSRYRKTIDPHLVQEKLEDLLMKPLRLTGEATSPKVESQFLKIKIYEQCLPQETYTFSLLEEYSKDLVRKISTLKKKLAGDRTSILIYTTLLFFFLAILEGFGAGIFRGIFLWASGHMLKAFIFAYLMFSGFKNSLSGLRKEAATCDKIVSVINKELIHLKLAFLLKTDYHQCLRELHNMEEWAATVNDKSWISYALGEVEEMKFNHHVLFPLKELKE